MILLQDRYKELHQLNRSKRLNRLMPGDAMRIHNIKKTIDQYEAELEALMQARAKKVSA